MAGRVAKYIPGYRLKRDVQFTPIAGGYPVQTLLPDNSCPVTTQVSVFLEVEGAAHYLPAYAGNLDIMTSAALRVGESIAERELAAIADGAR
jgi:acetaldehyde dehydrogenase